MGTFTHDQDSDTGFVAHRVSKKYANAGTHVKCHHFNLLRALTPAGITEYEGMWKNFEICPRRITKSEGMIRTGSKGAVVLGLGSLLSHKSERQSLFPTLPLA